jgi:hypothetical protein
MNGRMQLDRFAFVSMSFAEGKSEDPVYRTIVEACASLGYEARRADDLTHHGLIVEGVNELIDISRIVIAELSGSRPNVYHEVGYAHGLRKEVILLARAKTEISWVLSHRRIELWESLPELRSVLLAQLSAKSRTSLERSSSPWDRRRVVRPSSTRMSAAPGREHLLDPLRLRRVEPRDDHRTLGEMQPGILAYTQSWLLWRAVCDGARAGLRYGLTATADPVLDLALSCERSGSAEAEIAYTHSRELMVVFAIRPEDAALFSEPHEDESIAVTARLESDEEHCAFALVPAAWIRDWRARTTHAGEYADVVIDCQAVSE